MDLRKLFSILMLAVAPVLSGQNISWGALDVISGGNKSDAVGNVLGALVESAKSDVAQDASMSALDMIVSASKGSAGVGPLNALIKATSQSNYYKSGVLNIPSMAGNLEGNGNPSIWIGQMLPVPQWGQITSGFGFRPRFGRMHKGVDISMAVGDTVSPPLPGVVDRVGYEAGGYGNYIVVKHQNGLETRYAHLSVTLVGPGANVGPGTPMALSGNTGNSTGPHLHFETRINGTAIDPQEIFSFAGGKMLPRYGSSFGQQFAGTPKGTLSQISDNGIRGRSLIEKRTYVVKAGDTLSKIAARAGVSVIELCKMNFISEADPLVPGTMIRLRR